MAVPRPAPARRVFRPARRVSWGTRIFAFLVLLIALGSVGAFLEVFLPQQLASLAKSESSELQQARQGTQDVNTSVATLWSDLSKGSIGLSADQLTKDLALAQQIQQSTAAAMGHVQAAQAYMAQADGLPFQFHSPAFIATDRPAAAHLQNALNTALRLSTAAANQISIAQAMSQNVQTLATLDASVDARDWTGCTRTASSLSSNVKVQHDPANYPDTLLDPRWGNWIDAMGTVVGDAQQYCLVSAQNQASLAQQDAAILAAARSQLAADYSAAQSNASAWQQQKIQPLIDSISKETAAAGS